MYEEVKRILFDEKRSGMIVLENEAGKAVKFLQSYATVFESEIYCIVSPVVVVDNVTHRTGFVFKLLKTGELVYETDKNISSQIFNKYYSELSEKRDKI